MSVLPRIVDSLANRALEAFHLAEAIDHPGESGRAREEVIRQFIVEVIPPAFAVDTGFVIDASGGVSKQVDIVVYRREEHPVLTVGGVKHFMVESVAAAIEIKAVIDQRKTLLDALENVASVKALDRTGGGRNTVKPLGAPLLPDVVQHQVWCAVVAGRSMALDTCLDSIVDFLESRDRRVWPNSYVDIHEFLIHYVTMRNGVPWHSTSDPMAAEGISAGGGSQRTWGFSPPLAFFAVDLLDFLRVTPRIDFPVTSAPNMAGTDLGYFYRTLIPKGKGYIPLPHDTGEGGPQANP